MPTNFIENPESLLRKPCHCLVLPDASLAVDEALTLAPSATTDMAQKTLHEFPVLAVANMPVGPAVNMDTRNFELQTGLIMMVQANQFCGLPSEDANAHLQQFLGLCDTIVMKDVASEIIRLCLFLFSLAGKAK